jgi:hypothetical protein
VWVSWIRRGGRGDRDELCMRKGRKERIKCITIEIVQNLLLITKLAEEFTRFRGPAIVSPKYED